MIGDFLYALTARDEQVTPFEYVHEQKTLAGQAAQTFDFEVFIVPEGRILLLQRMLISGVGGGAVVLQAALGFVSHLNSDHWIYGNQVTGGIATLYSHVPMPGPAVWVEPGATIKARVTWSAGNLANVAVANIMGYMIPRGNLAV